MIDQTKNKECTEVLNNIIYKICEIQKQSNIKLFFELQHNYMQIYVQFCHFKLLIFHSIHMYLENSSDLQ